MVKRCCDNLEEVFILSSNTLTESFSKHKNMLTVVSQPCREVDNPPHVSLLHFYVNNTNCVRNYSTNTQHTLEVRLLEQYQTTRHKTRQKMFAVKWHRARNPELAIIALTRVVTKRHHKPTQHCSIPTTTRSVSLQEAHTHEPRSRFSRSNLDVSGGSTSTENPPNPEGNANPTIMAMWHPFNGI